MTQVRIRDTGEIVSQRQFRERHPNTSFPPVLDVNTLDTYGADPVLPSPRPTTDRLHIAYRDGVTQDANGNWVEAWGTRDIRDGKDDSELESLLTTLATERTEEFRTTRDEGIQGGFSYTFSDGSTAQLPTAIPDQAVRMQALAFRADRLERAGNGSQTMQFEDLAGQDVAQPASEVSAAVEAAVAKAQDWHDSFTTHKQAVWAIRQDTSKSLSERARGIVDYDPGNNGGWPE
jgi:hypothetical protein